MATERLEIPTTEKGLMFLRKLNLEEIAEIRSWRKNGPDTLPETLSILFKDGYCIEITYAFATGYQGTGPSGLYDFLTHDMHVSKDKAELVFKDEYVKLWRF